MAQKLTQNGSESVERWLSRLKPATQRTACWHLEDWLAWVHINGGMFAEMTPDELIKYQMEATNSDRFEILDLLQRYVLEKKNLRQSYKKKMYTFVRSFFLHNRADLPRDRSFRISGDLPKVVGSLTPEEIKQIIMSCNRVYAAIFMSIWQAALDQEMFTYWNMNGYKKLVDDLRELDVNPVGEPTIRIDLPGRKHAKFERPFYTFIARDSIDLIEKWLSHRPENAKAIFTNQYGQPFTKNSLKKYWMRHARRLGIMAPRAPRAERVLEGKHLHEIRDCWRSLVSKSPMKYEIAEFFMGHQVDALQYDKSFRDVDFYRAQYQVAAPYLNIMSTGQAFGRVDKNEVDRLNGQIQGLEAEVTRLRSGRNSEVDALRSEVEELKSSLRLIYEELKKDK